MNLGILFNLLLLPSRSSSLLTMHFIDVGHGDATLIQHNGKSLLIDAGSNDIGKTVTEYIRNAGVNKLDIIVASHPDMDHIGGMVDILKSFPPDLYIDNGEENDKSTYKQLMKYLEKKQIPYTVGRTGMKLPFSYDLTATITSPKNLGDDMDENSICLLLSYGSLNFFFPGDSETCDADADVVKLAHHGSKGSATKVLLSDTIPKTVIISVEKDKEKKIPDPSTIKALDEAGIDIHLTSKEGNIILYCDGSTYWFA